MISYKKQYDSLSQLGFEPITDDEIKDLDMPEKDYNVGIKSQFVNGLNKIDN